MFTAFEALWAQEAVPNKLPVNPPVEDTEPVIIDDPEMVNEPVTLCDPVKYSKLASISVEVKGRLSCPLYVNAMCLFYL